METIKRLLSFGYLGSADTTPENQQIGQTASRNATSETAAWNGTRSGYDEFASTRSTVADHIQATDNAPHALSTDTKQIAPTTPTTQTSTLLPISTKSHHPGTHNNDTYIKSGVIGFPQTPYDSHPVLPTDNRAEWKVGGNQIGDRGDTSSRSTAPQGLPYKGNGPAQGTSVLSPGGATLHQTNKDDYNSYSPTNTSGIKPADQSYNDDMPSLGIRRSFPLAGGVTTERPKEKSATSEREPGTKDKVVGIQNGQAREAVNTTTATTATYSSTTPRADQQPRNTQSGQGYHSALPATATAIPTAREVPVQNYEHDKHRGNQASSGLLSNSGKDTTATSNVRERRLHIPGEYPSSTPVDESAYLDHQESTVPTSGDQQALRHTGSLGKPQTKAADQISEPSKEHNYGRNAAITGGLGVASAGAYAAGKHQNDSASNRKETLPTEASPYNSTKPDPRLHGDSKPPLYDQHKIDSTTSENYTGREAVFPSSGTTKTRNAQQTTQPAPIAQDEKSNQHYSRDITKPDSGPASATIGPHKSNIANILDPRVQPDPALQKRRQASTSGDPTALATGPRKSDGTYVAVKSYSDHRSTQPTAPVNEQRYGPSTPGTTDPSAVGTQRTVDQTQNPQHHYGRDAAVVGGLGALGAGAYAVTHKNDTNQRPTTNTNQPNTVHRRYDSVQGPDSPTQYQKHDSPTEAVVGTAPGTSGAHAYPQQAIDKDRNAAQKSHEKQLKEQQKAKEDQEKAFYDKDMQIEREEPIETRQQSRLVAAEDKRHQKEMEKEREQHHQNPHHGKSNGAKGKGHRRLLSFLRRDKKEKDSAEDTSKYSKEYSVTGGATGGAAAYEAIDDGDSSCSECRRERNRQQKDLSLNHSPVETGGYRQQEQIGNQTHIATDRPIGDQKKLSRGSQSGAYEPGSQYRTVNETHAGVPKNVENYGNRHGGTNGGTRVGDGGQGQRISVTDWEDSRKATTPY